MNCSIRSNAAALINFFTFANLAIKSKIKDLFAALYFFGLRKIQFRKLFRSSFSTDMTIMRFAFLPDLNF